MTWTDPLWRTLLAWFCGRSRHLTVALAVTSLAFTGCATSRVSTSAVTKPAPDRRASKSEKSKAAKALQVEQTARSAEPTGPTDPQAPSEVRLAAATERDDEPSSISFPETSAATPSDQDLPLAPAPDSERSISDDRAAEDGESPMGPTQPIILEQVVDAIYLSFPLLRVAEFNRGVAAGGNLQAQGEFDLKLKADSINEPMGFYQNYRHGLGAEQPLFGGGTAFGGYRIGRGFFEPWYGERETNDGGEFKLGLSVPLLQNRAIDERRAQLWTTAYGLSLVEPEIQTQLLEFIRDGSVAYWTWVAAGQQYRFTQQLERLAEDRSGQLRKQVDEGKRAESDLIDNERLVVGRRVKQLDALRKVETAAAKLSLYLRMPDGQPFVPGIDLLPAGFPEPQPVKREFLQQDVSVAQTRRPEIAAYAIQRQMLEIELQQAQNQLLPALDVGLMNSKDVGGPASSKGDKTPYELEASVGMSVPLQRRKARGKITAVEAKIAQVSAKRQYTADKIAVEVQNAIISLDTAYRAIAQARQAVSLNAEMERVELIRLEAGDSDFLRLNLREQATFDARVALVEAHLLYFDAMAQYRAAIAADLPGNPIELPPTIEPLESIRP